MLYVVSYTPKPRRDISPFILEMQNTDKWWHFLDDTWLLATKESPEQLWRRLAARMLSTDHLLIVQITENAGYYGWLPQEAWDWLNENRNY